MQIIFSDEFRKQYKKIKNKAIRLKIIKNLKKLGNVPESGKSLRNKLKGHRTIKIPPFRIIYRIDNNSIFIICFDHRKVIYGKYSKNIYKETKGIS